MRRQDRGRRKSETGEDGLIVVEELTMNCQGSLIHAQLALPELDPDEIRDGQDCDAFGCTVSASGDALANVGDLGRILIYRDSFTRLDGGYSITSSAIASTPGGMIRPRGCGGLEVYHEFEFRGLHDRKLGRLFTPEYSADIDTGLTIGLSQAGAITDQTACSREFAELEHCRQGVMRCHRNKMIAPAGEERRSRDQHGGCMLLDKRRERRV
ncbi:MAG: hypothetical protein WDN50_06515 [Bradyrhizobium sp.]